MFLKLFFLTISFAKSKKLTTFLGGRIKLKTTINGIFYIIIEV